MSETPTSYREAGGLVRYGFPSDAKVFCGLERDIGMAESPEPATCPDCLALHPAMIDPPNNDQGHRPDENNT